MNAVKQAGWLCVALIVLSFSSWYFASSSPIVQLDEQTLSTTEDTIVHHLTVRQYDTDGHLVNYLHTPLMKHIPLNNIHWFQSPHVIIAQTDQPNWEIHAQQATSLHGGEQITFKKNVVIHQEKGMRTAASTLKTDELTYLPKDKLATTQAEVIFEQPGHTIQSKGMRAYLAEKRVQLLSQARGIYDPAEG